MQKILSTFIGFVMLTVIYSCNHTPDQAQLINQKSGQIAKLEVLCFHPTIRCTACNAVENNTIKILKESFNAQIENGTIKFASYNLEEEVNKPLVEKYQISFSSLLLVKHNSLNEVITDFTDKAFQYAQVKPIKFAELLKAEINKNLK
jgi:hypothetical protein